LKLFLGDLFMRCRLLFVGLRQHGKILLFFPFCPFNCEFCGFNYKKVFFYFDFFFVFKKDRFLFY